MTDAPHLQFLLLSVNQSSKETVANEALVAIDAILNTGVIDTLTAPPVSPVGGDVYIVGTSASGDWTGQDNNLAYYIDNMGWRFIVSKEGLTIWYIPSTQMYTFTSSAWSPTFASGAVTLWGVNATADTTNRLSVDSDAVLFNHNGTDSRVKINKNGNTDTASTVYQTAFTGHAEIGLDGTNDLHFKTSSDGATFYETIVLNSSGAEGRMGFFGYSPAVQQTGGAATAGVIYTATEQAMLQTLWDMARTYGLLN